MNERTHQRDSRRKKECRGVAPSNLVPDHPPLFINTRAQAGNLEASRLLDHYAVSATPGLQVQVVTADQVLFEDARGWADVQRRKPMTLDTTMMAYSMTTTFTAVAILQLAEQGLLKLSDSVSDYMLLKPLRLFPKVMDFCVRDPARHANDDVSKYSVINGLRHLTAHRLFHTGHQEKWRQLKTMYVNGPAFGGLIGTARAFGRFLQDQPNPRSVLLGRHAKHLLETAQSDPTGHSMPVPIGWHIRQAYGELCLYKERAGGGFRSEMRLYPARGVGTVAIANSAHFNTRKFLHHLDPIF